MISEGETILDPNDRTQPLASIHVLPNSSIRLWLGRLLPTQVCKSERTIGQYKLEPL